jgi:hypothetical protein
LSSYRSHPRVGKPALLLGYCRLSEKDINKAARVLAEIVVA